MTSPSIPYSIANRLILAAHQSHPLDTGSYPAWRRSFLKELAELISCEVTTWYSHNDLREHCQGLSVSHSRGSSSSGGNVVVPQATLRDLIEQAQSHLTSLVTSSRRSMSHRSLPPKTPQRVAFVPLRIRSAISPPNRRSSATFENYSWLFGIQFDSLGRWSCLIAARPFDQPDFTNLHIEILRLCLESMPPLWPLDCESKIHASLPITPRQREVVRCLLKGLPRKQIAASLGISVFTVNDHIKAIYEKLSVRSIGELASKFLDNQVPRTSPVLSESWIGPAPRN